MPPLFHHIKMYLLWGSESSWNIGNALMCKERNGGQSSSLETTVLPATSSKDRVKRKRKVYNTVVPYIAALSRCTDDLRSCRGVYRGELANQLA